MAIEEKPVYLTREGLARLEAELENLKTVQRPAVAERIHEAKLETSSSDNAELDDAQDEAAKIEARILQLEDMLRQARVIDDRHGTDKVTLGSEVVVRLDDGTTEHYVLVGKTEANPREGRISNESPVGQALLGRAKGEKVTVQTPGGIMTMTVESIA